MAVEQGGGSPGDGCWGAGVLSWRGTEEGRGFQEEVKLVREGRKGEQDSEGGEGGEDSLEEGE